MKIALRTMLLQGLVTSLFIIFTVAIIDFTNTTLNRTQSTGTDYSELSTSTCLPITYIKSDNEIMNEYSYDGYYNIDTTYFSISRVPKTSNSDPEKFKVIAKKNNGKTDKEYIGTIRFTGIFFPYFYTFSESDEGEHIFTLSYNLPKGEHNTSVVDVLNPNIKGETTIYAE